MQTLGWTASVGHRLVVWHSPEASLPNAEEADFS